MTTTASGTGGVQIRQAVRADLLDVFRIEQDSFPQPWPFAAFERFLDQPGFLVAECEGQDASTAASGERNGARVGSGGSVAGYVVADTVPNHGRRLGHVKDLAVHPDHRGRGIGSRLLERALGVMRGANATRVKLEVRASNETAIRLYCRHGFARQQRIPRYYDDGEDALVMVCEME